MDNDDQQVGRILSRREVLALFGAAGTTLLVGCSLSDSDTDSATATGTTSLAGAADPTETSQAATATVTESPTAAASVSTATVEAITSTSEPTPTSANAALPSCIVSPELTEGPYFVDEGLNRSDIRSDPSSGNVSEGTPLQLVLRVSQVRASGCTALQGAMVDIWQCDALGVYSDASDPGFDTTGQQFLRGYQTTDDTGTAQFTTIYPGWYQGRAVHIHFKVRGQDSSGQGYEFTSQFFFNEDLTDQVHAQDPYASKGVRTLRNEGDGIYQDGGDQLILNVTEAEDGYLGTFDIGVQVT